MYVTLTAKTHAGEQEPIALKARANLWLRKAGMIAEDRPTWTERSSKILLNTRESFDGAVHYVLHEQGPELPDD